MGRVEKDKTRHRGTNVLSDAAELCVMRNEILIAGCCDNCCQKLAQNRAVMP